MECNHIPLPGNDSQLELLTSVGDRPSAPSHKFRPILARKSEIPLSYTYLHKVDLSLPLESPAPSLSRWRSVPNNGSLPYERIQKVSRPGYKKLNNFCRISQPASKHFWLSIYSPNRFLNYISNVYPKSFSPVESITLEQVRDTQPRAKTQCKMNTVNMTLVPDKVPCLFNPCQLLPNSPPLAPLLKSKRKTKLHIFSVSIPEFKAESRHDKQTFPILNCSIPHLHKFKVQKQIASHSSQIRMDTTHFSELNSFHSSTYKNRMIIMNGAHKSDITSNELYVLGISNFKHNSLKPFYYTSMPCISRFTSYINSHPVLTPIINYSPEFYCKIPPLTEESLPFVFTDANKETSYGSPIQISSENSFLESDHLSLFEPLSFQSSSSLSNLPPLSSRDFTVPSVTPLCMRTTKSPSNRSHLNSNSSSSTDSTTDKSIISSINDIPQTNYDTNIPQTNYDTNIPLSSPIVPITHSKISPTLLPTIHPSKHNTLMSLNVHPTSTSVYQNKSLFKPYISPKQTPNKTLVTGKKKLSPEKKISRNRRFQEIATIKEDEKLQLQFKTVPDKWRLSAPLSEKDASTSDSQKVILSKVIQSLNDVTILEDCDNEYLEIQRRNKYSTLTQKLEEIMNTQSDNESSSNVQKLVVQELELQSAYNFVDNLPPNRIDSTPVSKNQVDKLSPTFVNEFVNELVFGIDFYNLITREDSSDSQIHPDVSSKDNIDYITSSSRAGKKELLSRHFHCASSRHFSFETGNVKLVKDQLRVNHKMRLIMEDVAKRKLIRKRLGDGLNDLFNITQAYTYSYYPSDIFTCSSFEELSFINF